jgi:hypothetical protein
LKIVDCALRPFFCLELLKKFNIKEKEAVNCFFLLISAILQSPISSIACHGCAEGEGVAGD